MGDIRRTYCAFILGMCSDVDPLDKVTTNAFTLKKKKCFTNSVSALQPYLSLCSSGPSDDFVAGKLLFLCPSFFFCLLFVG